MELKIQRSSKQYKSWVARIVGTDPKYGLAREFEGKREFNSEYIYQLADGIYEIQEGYQRRRFILIQGGEISKRSIDKSDVFGWLKDAPAEPQVPTFQLTGGSGYGCLGWEKGQVIHNSADRIAKGEPAYLTIVKASARWIREDGMSFGVGDEDGYYYTATAREATADEAAPVIAEELALSVRREARKALEQAGQEIIQTGERPEELSTPEGVELGVLNPESLPYGGGSWFVIGDEFIWFVKNNGHDGDFWANNNVRTAGAGAIGWKVPYTHALHMRLAKLDRDLYGESTANATGPKEAAEALA